MHATSVPIIAGVGASAGGVAALQAWFESLPADLGVAYIVILHISPEHPSELTAIISARTRMRVSEVTGDAVIEPDHIYVIPPDRGLQINDGIVSAHPFKKPRGNRTPIDDLFRSLAASHDHSFAVLLSGGGSDGSVGLKSVKEKGGLILVQDPQEAEYDSMPRSAIATGVADVVLPVRTLAARFAELVRCQGREAHSVAEPDADEQKTLATILDFLRARTGHDFSRYKVGTLRRRLVRRRQVSGSATLQQYLNYLRNNVEEVKLLFDDLLISVTTFFRDPAAFAMLEKKVIPRLFDERQAVHGLRVWVPGCATGEEVYSIVILLLEEAARRDIQIDIKVFGSDLDEGVLATAREGLYPDAIAADVSDQRLQRYFHKEDSHYRVGKELREGALFATHSLLKDPPFSRLDLISCRNLMIYLERELQTQVCGVFHYALRPRGYLFLGGAESAEESGLFRVIDKQQRIFQALERKANEALELSALLLQAPRSSAAAPPSSRQQRAQASGALHREALESLAPPSILVDEAHTVVHLSPSAGRFLLHPGGRLSSDLTSLVRPELQHFLRSALVCAFERQCSSLSLATPVRFDGSAKRVSVLVQPRPRADGEEQQALVFFLEGETVENLDYPESPGNDDNDARQLDEELRNAHEQLQLLRESYETSEEEFRAANEELQSVNEEYRSTTEELETSKEELHSMNEELQTVNLELRNKLDEVSRAHSDLQNLMAATDVGTLFLDLGLHIKRFTPRLGDLFNITPSDLERPITDFTHRLDYPGLEEDARRVIEHLAMVEREVGSQEGLWYLVRVRPYRTVDNRIDGVVLTFVDISERRSAEKALRTSQARLAHELEVMRRLHRMTVRVVTADDIEGALDEILAAAIELQGADLGSIQINHRFTGKPQIAVHSGVKGAALKALRESIQRPESATARALQQNKRYIIEDVRQAELSETYRGLAAKSGYRAVQATPLTSNRRQTLGVLVTHFCKPHRFSPSDERLLDVLARYAANVVERLQTESALKDLNESLERSVEKRTKRALENEQRFRALVEASAQMVWTTNGVGEIKDDSPSWRAFTGQTRKQWREQGWLHSVHPDERQSAAARCLQSIRSQEPLDAEFRVYHAASNGYRWINLRAVPLPGADKSIRGWVGMGSDVTDSKRSARQLGAMAATLTLAEEKERRRIAQILHDELQQLLFGIQLRVKSMIKSARAAEVPVLVEDAEQASQWLQDAIEKTRGLSLDLSPPLLEEDEDFESTLKWLGRRMREVASLDVEIRVTPRLPHIAAETRVRLFQIVRELLFNVAKHAATEHVKIRVRARKDELSLVIADDGVGFDVAAAMATRKTGLGLFSIRDRIGFYGGRIAIRSNPRRGTVVRLSIPLE